MEVSVVVPSHGRSLRLWWLLNALEEQTLERHRYEVVVVHDYDDAHFLKLLDEHPLASAGCLRQVRIEPHMRSPSRQRNIGWRAARAAIIAFTDDDCRPKPDWLATLLEVASRTPDGIVQGSTRPDPLERAVFAAPHHRTLRIEPPSIHAQTCNIAYPRALLERIGGFDEAVPAGDDTDLALRAKAAGANQTAAPEAVVFHAVEEFTLPEVLRANWRWRHLPYVVGKHPQLRAEFVIGLFWRETHAKLALALMGVAVATRWRPGALLAIPYVGRVVNRRGRGKRSRIVGVFEFPGQLVVDLAEMLTMLSGSLRYRVPML